MYLVATFLFRQVKVESPRLDMMIHFSLGALILGILVLALGTEEYHEESKQH